MFPLAVETTLKKGIFVFSNGDKYGIFITIKCELLTNLCLIQNFNPTLIYFSNGSSK